MRVTALTEAGPVDRTLAITAATPTDWSTTGTAPHTNWTEPRGLDSTYLYGPSSSPAAMVTPAGSDYYAYDAYGNVSDLTDTTGATQWAYQYDPFGVVRSAVNVSGNAPTNPFQYAGQYTDAASGLSDMRARQYDPTTGGFLTVDPLHETTTLASSPYAYAGDLPILYGDPSGLCLGGWFGSGSCSSEISSGVSDLYNGTKAVYNDVVKPVYNYVVKPLVVDPIKQTVQADWSCVTSGHNCASAVVQTALWALPVDGLLSRDLAFAGGDAIRTAIRDAGKDISDRVSSGIYRLANEEKGSIDLLAGGGGGAGANDALAKTAADSLHAAEDSTAATFSVAMPAVFRAGGDAASGGAGLTVDEARAAAQRNGIDTRSMNIQYGGAGREGSTDFGSTGLTWAGPLLRGPSGQFEVTLYDAGLASEENAVNTLAHELNHIRDVMRTGEWPDPEDEQIAREAGNTAQRYFRP